MATHQDKKNKNMKKVATKPAKQSGHPAVPKYVRDDSTTGPLDLTAQAKKGKK
ncbi:hypothetical protein FAES_4415 [Fibrella aestuarina BUZ 2]|uniref:Uncharacterized protein n=1 Tax=Fibrella aestuarina BUZ 2 TaxID=1166018 RepID=I0KE61_9BACT|nr:hypothetical protein [Fibrella aestuarina]CCH02414.1 hypothetical protein FAES_4415 [Fibrella aestuarina BUZ 2]